MVMQQQPTIPPLVESAIIEREGISTYAAMLDEWTLYDMANHFAENYKFERLDVHESIIIDTLLDMLPTGELEAMIRFHHVANILECAYLSGYITEMHGYYVISVNYPVDVKVIKKDDYRK